MKKKHKHSGKYIVGEEGPEVLHMEPGSKGYVTPNPKTTKHMKHRQFGGDVLGAISKLPGGQIPGGSPGGRPMMNAGPIARGFQARRKGGPVSGKRKVGRHKADI